MKRLSVISFFVLLVLVIINAQETEFSKLTGPYLGQEPPGMKPEIFAPGIVSTEDCKEFGCTFTPNGKEFYFTRGDIELHQNTIMVCQFKNGQWLTPAPAKFSNTYYDDEPHVSVDGKFLFFGSERSKPVVSKSKYGLWMMERSGAHWGEPRYYGIGMYITSTKDHTIYYTVPTENADWEIVKARYINGCYTEPELLGGSINSQYFDAHPCIAPDESFLIFDSKRPGAVGGEGDIDLYICFRNEKGLWGEAIHMGDKINSPAQDHVASMSPDCKYLFFAHGKQDRWDIYWVNAKVIEELKPDELK